MGVSMRLYIGPCVRCPNPTITGPVELPGCPKCQTEIKESFCGKCGSPKGTFTKIQVRPKVIELNVDDQLRLVDHGGQNLDIYIPDSRNIPGIKRQLLHDAKYDPVMLTFTEEQMKDEIVEFVVYFNKEITKIKETYGEYTVQWGTFFWFS